MKNKILPKEIKNQYQGHPIAFWGFVVFLMMMTWRSIIHLAYQKFGLHEIANFIVLTGDPDPMPLIYLFFSLWGLAQLLFCLICWIVVFRYKELISLMYILFISEWLVRLVFYPLIGLGLANNEIYSNGSTPGSYLAPFIVMVLLVLFFLSMKQSKSANS